MTRIERRDCWLGSQVQLAYPHEVDPTTDDARADLTTSNTVIVVLRVGDFMAKGHYGGMRIEAASSAATPKAGNKHSTCSPLPTPADPGTLS